MQFSDNFQRQQPYINVRHTKNTPPYKNYRNRLINENISQILTSSVVGMGSSCMFASMEQGYANLCWVKPVPQPQGQLTHVAALLAYFLLWSKRICQFMLDKTCAQPQGRLTHVAALLIVFFQRICSKLNF